MAPVAAPIDMTIAGAIDDFLTTMRKSPRTVTTYGYGLRKFVAFLAAEGVDAAVTPVAALTTGQVVDFSAWMLPLERQTREDVGATRTALTYSAAVRKFYKHLVANDLHPSLSLEKMGLQLAAQQTGFAAPPPDVRTRDLDRILQFLITQPHGEKPEAELRRLKVAALIRFLYRTGMRVSECCALRRGEIDLEDGTAFVFRGKGGKSRRVYFDTSTAEALTRYWAARLDGSQPIALASLPAFSGRDMPGKPGDRITARSAQRIVQEVARQSGIAAHITPHSFRHGLATQLVEGKVPAPVVQRVLGHANLATTQVYVHLVDAEVRAEYQEAFGEYRPAATSGNADDRSGPPHAITDTNANAPDGGELSPATARSGRLKPAATIY